MCPASSPNHAQHWRHALEPQPAAASSMAIKGVCPERSLRSPKRVIDTPQRVIADRQSGDKPFTVWSRAYGRLGDLTRLDSMPTSWRSSTRVREQVRTEGVDPSVTTPSSDGSHRGCAPPRRAKRPVHAITVMVRDLRGTRFRPFARPGPSRRPCWWAGCRVKGGLRLPSLRPAS